MQAVFATLPSFSDLGKVLGGLKSLSLFNLWRQKGVFATLPRSLGTGISGSSDQRGVINRGRKAPRSLLFFSLGDPLRQPKELARRVEILEGKPTLRQLRSPFGGRGPKFFLASVPKCTAALGQGELLSYDGEGPRFLS
ncbi:MAG TPA: hypothetical protein VGX70_18425 [Gemmataceae bacterium]|nr:hypothetical protein [Gemmataceae bacterium]